MNNAWASCMATKFGWTVRVCFNLSVDDITLQDLSLTPALGGLPVYLPACQACLMSPLSLSTTHLYGWPAICIPSVQGVILISSSEGSKAVILIYNPDRGV